MPNAVPTNKAIDPSQIRLLGAIRKMLNARRLPNLIEQFHVQ
jgi:hypothetical protein